MAIKLVAIDIDGTLINDERAVTPRTIAAIKQASAAGVKIVLCTGRPMTGVRPFLKQLDLDHSDHEYVVAFNGGLAQDTNGQVIVNYTVDFDDYIDILGYATKQNVKSVIETQDYIYTTNQDISPYAVHESGLVFMPMRYRSLDQINSMRDQLVIGKFMMTDDQAKLDDAHRQLPDGLAERFKIVRSEDFYLEFVNKRAGKGATLAALCDHLGIEASEVMAIGNAQNDESMIEYAGVGVAMGNSISSTIQKADVTVADNNHDGVAEAIQKYV
ncbi:Cof-type HAD-IIB family hydrolase [uncultured Limosilactobacillus sp.]|uniref:Cof-type HAD-IIB family hydrolase n=1 Tax=uncultured Limosilactobacillus sp. TaxID=2837629 RepID=UPI0025DA8EDD|nr:Cof-type HAD-IIB family hydrolase [uncultured Limosilactobacillus sp.]